MESSAVVVTNQPVPQDGWMKKPEVPMNCPSGLEYLTLMNQLIVYQKKSLLKIFTGCETRNKFTLVNSLGQVVYEAKEESDCLTRYCLGYIRPYDIEVKDTFGNEVIHVYRRLACDSCCFPCYLQVLSSDGETEVGTISKQWSGIVTELFTDADKFGISFPVDLDVRMKAVLIGSVFLINSMYFEQKN